MKRRTTGTILLLVAAFLYGIRYLSAAIFGSNVNSWNGNLFDSMLSYIGKGPVILSVLALILGLIYLVWAEIEELRNNNLNRKKNEVTGNENYKA